MAITMYFLVGYSLIKMFLNKENVTLTAFELTVMTVLVPMLAVAAFFITIFKRVRRLL